jgi:hypothetical protein
LTNICDNPFSIITYALHNPLLAENRLDSRVFKVSYGDSSLKRHILSEFQIVQINDFITIPAHKYCLSRLTFSRPVFYEGINELLGIDQED